MNGRPFDKLRANDRSGIGNNRKTLTPPHGGETMTLKKTIIIAAVVIAIPALALAWWLLSPLLLDTTVEEEFQFSATADMPAGMSQVRGRNRHVRHGQDKHGSHGRYARPRCPRP